MEARADCKDDTTTDTSEKEELPVLSKNQLKKQQRLKRWAETKMERRKKERLKIKERKKKMLEEVRKQGLEEESLAVKKKRMDDPEASNIRVAIDCSYDSLMTESDIKKLIKQMQRCYSENRKSNKPLQLYITSLKDKTKKVLSQVVSGYSSWDVHMKEEEPYTAFGAENIVYLAAESPNVLQDLDPNKVYIIGGLVDHNHHKGYCYERVLEQGWNHAQLPIGDFVKLNSRKVLAVNHVYEIILAYIQCGNWKEAFFQVLPNRKVREFVPENEANADSCTRPALTDSATHEHEQYATKDRESCERAVLLDNNLPQNYTQSSVKEALTQGQASNSTIDEPTNKKNDSGQCSSGDLMASKSEVSCVEDKIKDTNETSSDLSETVIHVHAQNIYKNTESGINKR